MEFGAVRESQQPVKPMMTTNSAGKDCTSLPAINPSQKLWEIISSSWIHSAGSPRQHSRPFSSYAASHPDELLAQLACMLLPQSADPPTQGKKTRPCFARAAGRVSWIRTTQGSRNQTSAGSARRDPRGSPGSWHPYRSGSQSRRR